MQDLNLMAIYAHVVASGSFSAAALRLGTSRSAVSKAVAKLEHSLGVRLLHRSTRHLSVTEVGAVFVEHCNRIVEEMVQAEQVASSLHAQPRGTLRVAASVAFGTLHVAPALADFLGRYPDLDVDMTISDRSIDLAEEGYDVIVRVASELPLSVVARQLAPVRRKLCATPEYFARHGLPRIPQDLSRHNCLDYTHSGEQGVSRASGASPDRRARSRCPWPAACASMTTRRCPRPYSGSSGLRCCRPSSSEDDLQAGRLCAALSEYIPVERHVYALYLPTRHLPAKVRTFINFLLEHIGPEPYWDEE